MWRRVEPKEQEFNWGQLDAWVEWLTKHRVPIKAAPLVAFNEGNIPDWLYIWEHDFETVRDLVERPALAGLVAQGDRRTWNRPMDKQPQYRYWAKATGVLPGWIKRDRVGCYTTHMHSPDGNEPYTYGYMFLYKLPIPTGARHLRLPDDRRIRLFAATVVKGASSAQPAAALYDAYPAARLSDT